MLPRGGGDQDSPVGVIVAGFTSREKRHTNGCAFSSTGNITQDSKYSFNDEVYLHVIAFVELDG
jgi:hypothetical protein